jgi:hypothetical protein
MCRCAELMRGPTREAAAHQHITESAHLNDVGRNAAVVDGGAKGLQLLVRADFDGTLPFVMNEQGALLGLLGLVAAHVNQGFDDVVEGVYLVVVHDQVAQFYFFFKQQNLLIVLNLRAGVHRGKITQERSRGVADNN